MPLFNFQKQFAPDVESGEKRQTIRARRKNRPQVGQTAYLYTGARTKACRKLGEEKIVRVVPVLISNDGLAIGASALGVKFEKQELDTFAKNDGFQSWESMRDWFKNTHGLPFPGDLIQW
jgi:hypothetical protein